MYPQTGQVTIHSSFGKDISLGNGIFINQSITFVDLGGIYLEDNVVIEPRSRLLTVNHLVDPVKIRGIIVDSTRLKENAWIGPM